MFELFQDLVGDYLKKVEEIRARFIDTNGEGWSPNDLKNYVNEIDEKTAKTLLRHYIIMEWNRKMEEHGED